MKIVPTNTVKDNSDIQFDIRKDLAPNTYFDFQSSYLYLVIKVLQGDGSTLPANEDVAICNNFHSCVFSNCEVTIEGKTLSNSANLYPYRGILSNVLGYGTGMKTSLLTASGYYPNAQNTFNTNNLRYIQRKGMCMKSISFEVVGRPSASLFEVSKWMPSGFATNIRFTRNSSAFCLDSKYKQDVHLFN